MKSSFAKTDKRHPKIEFFKPPCDLHYLVFNIKICFGKNWQSTVCLPAKTCSFLQKLITTTFAGWRFQFNPKIALVGFCKWTLHFYQNDLLTSVTLSWCFTLIWSCHKFAWGTCYYDQVWSNSILIMSEILKCWQKKRNQSDTKPYMSSNKVTIDNNTQVLCCLFHYTKILDFPQGLQSLHWFDSNFIQISEKRICFVSSPVLLKIVI